MDKVSSGSAGWWMAWGLCAVLWGASACAAQQPSPRSRPRPQPMPPPAARVTPACLDAARALAARVERCHGPARAQALERAAAAYDRCAAGLAGAISAEAAWTAAELWRRHGSLLLAEQSYLRAAQRDRRRYGQRGLLGAADMQRRQHRRAAAAQTYKAAERADPATGGAQRARLWVARMLLADDKVAQAIVRFQSALECASTPRQSIEAADYLAKAWIRSGDLDSARRVLEHVDRLVHARQGEPAQDVERLRAASRRMSARKALQRALDVRHRRGADAVRLDEHRRRRDKRDARIRQY